MPDCFVEAVIDAIAEEDAIGFGALATATLSRIAEEHGEVRGHCFRSVMAALVQLLLRTTEASQNAGLNFTRVGFLRSHPSRWGIADDDVESAAAALSDLAPARATVH